LLAPEGEAFAQQANVCRQARGYDYFMLRNNIARKEQPQTNIEYSEFFFFILVLPELAHNPSARQSLQYVW
jgi:hypothetical protein